ncbi:type VI secretion system baseplate subunit TssF [Enterovibrio sp. ZSDZ35]|uniref:Type VI secretion system baseplate subunit TssF n=1 Tax=Enterovibrio qingdaonensis TaxID=2899818 RepID=A0ABT5QHP5_9GAMM|nr:type VI secretion system baseplate subunit TssF [Enterovibrio sp. ZSDZ35]MDD1780504.1 type VI secretion system baseplate subunit TssF [Enterovibrio sp. ZSDZ35]
MGQNRYFREELTFLKEQGVEFSKVYPQLSRFLNSRSTDPDVERLLEGFAFLTGRLREKIDDEFPELTHSIINMLWPNYLRQVPSICILKFNPVAKSITEKQTVKQSTEVESTPVYGTACRYTSCRDVDVYPIDRTTTKTVHSRDSSIVDVGLQIQNGLKLDQIGLTKLRFFLGGDNYSSETLYLWLNHHLSKIEIVTNKETVSIPKSCLSMVGFDAEDGILPYPQNVYEGYRVLQEYLSFPVVFKFFDISDLNDFLFGDVEGDITLRFVFSKALPSDVRVTDNQFSLYCTPAINLFQHDAEPIDLNGKRTEYKISPSNRSPSHFEVFSVEGVRGWIDAAQGKFRGHFREYQPFESFSHEIERAKNRVALYYRVRVKEGMTLAGLEHYISFIRGDETACVGDSEAISLSLTCSNRQLPLELGVGDIHVATDSSPTFATFENITEPTAPIRPALDGSLLWTLISNLSLNYLSILSKEALSSVIKAYDFRALVDRQAERISKLRNESIVDIKTSPVEKLIKGLPVRGLKSEITLDQSAFGSEGELYLFGSILSRFFSLYASINSFHELVVINANNKERYSWGIQSGEYPLI